MDTTYFGRKFGVMIFMDSFTGQILYKQYVKNETNALYYQGIEEIVRRGISVQSIICDGRKGIIELFPETCTLYEVRSTKYSLPIMSIPSNTNHYPIFDTKAKNGGSRRTTLISP
jgi:hypothetical protein